MLFVESDNALGSALGDVDDGFALAALFKSATTLAGVGSIYGNTSEPEAARNNRRLGDVCGYGGAHFRGAASKIVVDSETVGFLNRAHEIDTLLCLGPLTTPAQLIRTGKARLKEIVFVGAHLSTRGRFPPLWPFEFNVTLDVEATRTVFDFSIPITVVPLDVAKNLRITQSQLRSLPGKVGVYLKEHGERWLKRARYLKFSNSVPVWDLVAAAYVIEPSLFRVEKRLAKAHANGWIQFGKGREVSIVTQYSPGEVWTRFSNWITD